MIETRALLASLACLLLMASSCVARPRMCVAESECGPSAACVGGRCLPEGGIPAIQTARRVLFAPVDLAYLRRGGASSEAGAPPPLVVLGRNSDRESKLLLRFSVPLPPEATVIEAYLLLDRSDLVDSDPEPIALHAARIAEPWDSRSVTWATQPRIDDLNLPSTTVRPEGGPLVRVDVRDLVAKWRTHDARDQGIAVVAETSTPSGIAFALGPRLELYVK
jgi:hypothetical protein